MAAKKKRKIKVRDSNLEVMRKMKSNKVHSKKRYKRQDEPSIVELLSDRLW